MDLSGRVKKRIKELMDQRAWSVYDLSQKSDLTEACIRNWYTKRNYTPSLEAIEKICKAFEISVAELVRDETEDSIVVDAEKKELLKNWSNLETKQKKVVCMQIEKFLNKD